MHPLKSAVAFSYLLTTCKTIQMCRQSHGSGNPLQGHAVAQAKPRRSHSTITPRKMPRQSHDVAIPVQGYASAQAKPCNASDKVEDQVTYSSCRIFSGNPHKPNVDEVQTLLFSIESNPRIGAALRRSHSIYNRLRLSQAPPHLEQHLTRPWSGVDKPRSQ